MAITDIARYAHLTQADIDLLSDELDTIRRDVEDQRGERDSRYIRRVIAVQRGLEIGARALLMASRHRVAWVAGSSMLACSKILENMELAHNISHGQWDWMNDPEIHSTSWEWDQVGPSSQWKRAHNYSHHLYTNVVGMDDDIGFGILRMTRDVEWRPINLIQPLANVVLATTFEWGIARHDLDAQKRMDGDEAISGLGKSAASRSFWKKIGRQVGKDFVLFPALAGRGWKSTLKANASANLVRNLWAYAVIFCGHFPDGAEKFTMAEYENETRPQWYLRQMLGSANFDAGPVMAIMSGNLCYQIEHHLFPDLPSNRYAEIAERVEALCEKFDLPYTTGSLPHQYWLALRTVHKLALPDRFLSRSSDDAPETSSEHRFSTTASGVDQLEHGNGRRGLKAALSAAMPRVRGRGYGRATRK